MINCVSDWVGLAGTSKVGGGGDGAGLSWIRDGELGLGGGGSFCFDSWSGVGRGGFIDIDWLVHWTDSPIHRKPVLFSQA